MPLTPYFTGVSGLSSIFNLTTEILSFFSSAISSKLGAICLHGAHHSAQKSTKTGEFELITSFSLERVSKSGAVFDVQKLNYFNNHYIKNYPIHQ